MEELQKFVEIMSDKFDEYENDRNGNGKVVNSLEG